MEKKKKKVTMVMRGPALNEYATLRRLSGMFPEASSLEPSFLLEGRCENQRVAFLERAGKAAEFVLAISSLGPMVHKVSYAVTFASSSGFQSGVVS